MGHHKITTKWYTNKVERMEISLPCWNGISAGSDWQRTMSEGFLTTEMLRRGAGKPDGNSTEFWVRRNSV